MQKKNNRISMAYRDGVRPGPPTVNVTAQHVLGSSPILAMFFGFSALGTVCCLSGKSVKLTGLREFSQIMWPVSRLENFVQKCELLLLATKSNNSLVYICDTPVRRYFVIQANCKFSKLSRCVITSGYHLTVQ